MAPLARGGHRRSCGLVGRIRGAHLAVEGHRDASRRSRRKHPWALPHPAGAEKRAHHPDRPQPRRPGDQATVSNPGDGGKEERDGREPPRPHRQDRISGDAPHRGGFGGPGRPLARSRAAFGGHALPRAQRPKFARPQHLVSPMGQRERIFASRFEGDEAGPDTRDHRKAGFGGPRPAPRAGVGDRSRSFLDREAQGSIRRSLRACEAVRH